MTVNKNIIGSRVTCAKQLTVGRWYAIQTNMGRHNYPIVHGKYVGISNDTYHAFKVCGDDVSAYNSLSDTVLRSDITLACGKKDSYDLAVYKFTTHPDKVPGDPVTLVPFKDGTKISDIPAKVGDRFVLVRPRSDVGKSGDIVELLYDDGSSSPYFGIVGVAGAEGKFVLSTNRLAPLPQAAPQEPPAPPIHEVDVIKTAIDRLVASSAEKREHASVLIGLANAIEEKAEEERTKLAGLLNGYLPTPKPSTTQHHNPFHRL